MRRWSAVLSTVVVLGLFLVVVKIFRDVNHMTWMDYTPGEIDRVAVGIEAFREEKGA